MYEKLNAIEADFAQLKNLLPDPAAESRVEAMRVALEQTAEAIAARSAVTAVERATLATLYRGMLAASRIVRQIRTHQTGEGANAAT